MFVVMGVSGNTGKVVADRLLSQGAPVRVVVRDAAKGAPWAARGAEVAVADLTDQAGLTAAFAGASAAYVLLPPNPVSTDFVAEQAEKCERLAQALEANAVGHVVLLSSVAAQFPAGTGPILTVGRAELRLASATPRLTALRAAYFIENWGGSLGGIADGIFPTFLHPDGAFDMVATADIGRVAADALLAGGVAGKQIIELSSSAKAWSPREIAALVSAIVGRELTVIHAPMDAVVPTLTSYGMSTNVAGLYREMMEGFSAGGDPWERTGWTVRGPTGPEQVLRGLLGK